MLAARRVIGIDDVLVASGVAGRVSAVLSYKVSPFWGLFALGALGA
jgi:hypothetical protein